MWRAENGETREETADTEVLRVPPTSSTPAFTGPQAVTVGDHGFVPVNIAAPAWERWRDELGAVGGPTPLLHFDDSVRTRIELSTTH
ncbi:MAG: hypothetical protein ACTHJL_06240, partial [Amnibacterium sp.]